ncbi:MAG: hypothetical protein K9L68_08440 [Spirochaetales bacterium]|nr:hypothetical protein [Spirochaetales bacterium]MCF7938612.1 hypothetical protein [Spirochaetales bacterium]
MATVANLNDEEKMFLAGCIKKMLLSDDSFADAEMDDLERLRDDWEFADLDDSLETFESSVEDEESFWTLAEKIYNTEAQEVILQILDEIAFQDGIPTPEESEFFHHLQELWNR